MDDQFLYCGRWVKKAHFRAFVYKGESQKLANSYAEYEELIGSGLWFPSKDEEILTIPRSVPVIRKKRKVPDGADS